MWEARSVCDVHSRPVGAERRRPHRYRTALLFVAALAVMALGAPAAFAATTKYAIPKPACKPPAKRHASCLAIERLVVPKAHPGARPFTVGSGVKPSAAGTKPSYLTVGPAGGLTPYDFQQAYNFNAFAGGANQTVAIVDAFNDPNIQSDLGVFDTQYGLSACTASNGCLTVVGQTGSSSSLPPDDTSGWSIEETLDVETVHSVCRSCKILLVETNDNSFANLEAGVNEAATLGATEISNSYGGNELGSTSTDEAAYNHPGIVVTASSGDDGYYEFDQLAANNAPESPAAFPDVVAVGGTSLYLSQNVPTRQSESIWNDNGVKDYYEQHLGAALGAGGGGCSTLYRGMAWQIYNPSYSSTACGTNRLVADVSADADYLTGFDIYDSYDYCGGGCEPNWATYGGTSLASPLIAGMWGDAGGAHGINYPAVSLYSHLGTSALYDVTNGGNGWCDGEGASSCGDPNTIGYGIVDCDYPASGSTPSAGDRACDALSGYDGPSGVGTPNGLTAFTLAPPTATVHGPTAVTHGTSNGWTVTTTEPTPGAAISAYQWSWGDGTTTNTSSASASHTYTTPGTYKIYVRVYDSDGQTGLSSPYSVTVS
jgi:subtilase family serine protease